MPRSETTISYFRNKSSVIIRKSYTMFMFKCLNLFFR